ncbi:hypothetical protein CRG98_013068 [Punica granatum]|uniref:Uncharacterized protein n=1 Tax=Punica granatum TaxID=22663 RepID=A0A2I0KDC9_PUNGR|nr:hypothetical protein CRG98_013068 [Punica granatum]
MVKQLAANVATNMTELIAQLRDQNRASSTYTRPPKNRQTVDPNPAVPPTLVLESEEVSFSVMTHLPAAYPVTDPLPLCSNGCPIATWSLSIGILRCARPVTISHAGSTPSLHRATFNRPSNDERSRSCSHC